jgi:Na+-transporting methylmalonyl-CoA/oxaloacetate decarboxylase gamma subunit
MNLLQVCVSSFNRDKKQEKSTNQVKNVQNVSVQTTDEDVIIAAIAAAVHDKQLNS